MAMLKAVIFDLFHTLTSLEVSGAPGRSTAEALGVDRDAWNRFWLADPMTTCSATRISSFRSGASPVN